MLFFCEDCGQLNQLPPGVAGGPSVQVRCTRCGYALSAIPPLAPSAVGGEALRTPSATPPSSPQGRTKD